MLIKQDNIVIRNAEATDAPLLGKWWRDGKIMAHAGFPNGLSITDDEIANSLSTDTDETCRRLIIEVDSSPVGEMNCRNIGDNTAEIGIKICDESMQEKGYGSTILRIFINELFCKYGYEKMVLDTNLENKRAQHVYEKLGFRKVGIRYDSWKNQLGELQTAVDYEMTKTDYFSNNKADVTIIPYERKYRDDMLFCYLLAKDAVNAYATEDCCKKPTLKDDLLDIEGQYINRGDVFYLAVDKNDRVVGMVGTYTESLTDMWLKRLFVKPEMKGKGIGSKLLEAVEKFAADKGIKRIHTRFAPWYHEASRFYPVKGFVEADIQSTADGEPERLRHMVKIML